MVVRSEDGADRQLYNLETVPALHTQIAMLVDLGSVSEQTKGIPGPRFELIAGVSVPVREQTP